MPARIALSGRAGSAVVTDVPRSDTEAETAELPVLADVLLVETDPSVVQVLAAHLDQAGYRVTPAAGADAARAALRSASPDLVILNLLLPGDDGLALFMELRTALDAPIVLVSPTAEEADRALGLDLGADDFVPRPVSPRELVARVRAVLRRAHRQASAAPPEFLTAGRLVADAGRRRVRVQGRWVALTAVEFALLAFLMRHPGVAFSRERLLEEVWGYTVGGATTVTVHVRRLREKIEPDPAHPRFVRTVWGSGYCLSTADG